MKNPLIKRLPREFAKDASKYIAIFLMMVMLISVCSAVRVSNESMKAAYYDSFELYNVEDGHITFDKKLPADIRNDIEKELEIKLYENNFFDEEISGTAASVRVYRQTDEVNKPCLLSGELPSADNEIAIDRVFAKNNEIAIGDKLTVNTKDLTVSSFIALSDYSTLFESNTDTMFDSINFSVAVMTDTGFDSVNSKNISLNYAWIYNEPCADDYEAAERSEKLMDILEDEITEYDEKIIEVQIDEITDRLEKASEEYAELYLSTGQKPAKTDLSVPLDDFLFGITEDAVSAEINGEEYEMPDDEEFEDEIDKTEIITVENYLPRYLNQAITFAIDDIGGDETLMMMLAYMMITVLAFIFAVTISNTIVSEAGVIGTLRASGYTKGELIRHYMIIPIIVTLISAAVGNILGYTVMKDFFVSLYRNSYSLTAYTTKWDASAFVLSTVVPIILMLVINLAVLVSKLKLSPLKFLRRDLKKKTRKKAMRLNTKIPFKTRFSLRIFFTNLPGYIVMMIGILFGGVLISFGDMFPRMMDSLKEIIIEDMICEYQYVLYDPENADEISDEQAEKYASKSFDFSKEGFLNDSITVYGIEKNSRYVPAESPAGKVLISTGISEKFGLNEGDTIRLDEKYKRDSPYEVEVGGVYDYLSSLAIFMNLEDYNSTLGEKPDYFTGYFSDREITELDDEDAAAVITEDDYTKVSDQLDVSMSGMMIIWQLFGAAFFIIVVYVLCKQVIERNFQSIAMTKILGFKNSEISGLYIASTSIAVFLGLLISVPLIDIIMRAVFKGYIYTKMTGFFPYLVSPVTYVVTIVTGLVCYGVVALLQMRKVSKVSKSEALKNVE